MDIFKRLSRLARAEYHHLRQQAKIAFADDETEPPPRHEEPEPRPAPREPVDPDRARYPKEIREAYAALEIPLGADRQAVKAAYREMLRRYHPDKHQREPEKVDTANELTRRLREAYERLDAWLAGRS